MPVVARCSSGHSWATSQTEVWAVVPPRRTKSRIITLDTPFCPSCGGPHTSFTDASHLPATPSIPLPPPEHAPEFVRARCSQGHEWQSTAQGGKLIDPVCPNCFHLAVSFTSLRHG